MTPVRVNHRIVPGKHDSELVEGEFGLKKALGKNHPGP